MFYQQELAQHIFWSASRKFLTSICFRIGLDIDSLILVLNFDIFANHCLNGRLPSY